MTTDELLKVVLETLEDGKARDVLTLDVRGRTSIADYMVIATGTSERHVKSLGGHVSEDAKKHDVQPLGVEGETVGDWVLVDLGDVIVHVMRAPIREFYQLEKLWQGDSVSSVHAA